jgi:RND family efflux transporter MFP subunit
MKKKLILIIVVLLIVFAAVLFLKNKEKNLANLPKPQTPPPSVQVAPVAQGALEVTSHYLATIEPLVKSDLSPRITGAILSVSKREGDAVREGELLATIDDRELQDRTVAVNADLLATRQRLAGAESAYISQKSVYDRDEILYKAGAISKETLERSRATLDGARAVVDAYQESLKGLAMNTNVAKTQAGYARIVAPFSGVISKRWSDPGDLAAPGKPILTLEKTSPYKILAQAPQEELVGIKAGAKVTLTNGNQHVVAKVHRVYPALAKNMLATVEVLTVAAPFNLPSSATVGFDIVTEKVEGLILPAQSVVRNGQGTFVYQVKDGAIKIIPVKLLGMENGAAAISGPIEAGSQVALGQENKLLTFAEGAKVRVAEAAKPAGAASPATGGKQ